MYYELVRQRTYIHHGSDIPILTFHTDTHQAKRVGIMNMGRKEHNKCHSIMNVIHIYTVEYSH